MFWLNNQHNKFCLSAYLNSTLAYKTFQHRKKKYTKMSKNQKKVVLFLKFVMQWTRIVNVIVANAVISCSNHMFYSKSDECGK